MKIDLLLTEIKESQELIAELEEKLAIDVFDLEGDCANHSTFFLQAARISSLANLLYNRSDLMVKETRAEVATDIRNDPNKYGITKITEGQVDEAVTIHEEVKLAHSLRIQCAEFKNLADALVSAFEHRRSMLNNEVQLKLSGLSEPEQQAKREMTEREIVRKKIIKRKQNEEKN